MHLSISGLDKTAKYIWLQLKCVSNGVFMEWQARQLQWFLPWYSFIVRDAIACCVCSGTAKGMLTYTQVRTIKSFQKMIAVFSNLNNKNRCKLFKK